jgi:thioredoxin-related protein
VKTLITILIAVSSLSYGSEKLEVTHEKHADSIRWQTDYSAALQQARKENKPVLLFFTGSDWCGWCKRLEREVFSQKEFAKLAGNEFIFVEIDRPMRTKLPEKLTMQNEQLVKQFNIEYFPTVVIVSPSGEKLGSTGYQDGGSRAYYDHLKQIMGSAMQFDVDLEQAVAGKLGGEELQALYQTSHQLGRDAEREQLLAQGLKQRAGGFFLLEQYRELLEAGQGTHPETLQLRDQILSSGDKSDASLQLALVEFNYAADQPHMSPHEVITPLTGYLREFEANTPDNAWRVQLFLSQFLLSRGEKEQALDYAQRSLANVPDSFRPSVEGFLEQMN